MKDPIRYSSGVKIDPYINKVIFAGSILSIAVHCLANQYIWKIDSTLNILKAALWREFNGLILNRIFSNTRWRESSKIESVIGVVALSNLFFLDLPLHTIDESYYIQICSWYSQEITPAAMSLPLITKYWLSSLGTGCLVWTAMGIFAGRYSSDRLNALKYKDQITLQSQHRATLGVADEATNEEIRRAYLTLVKTAHSDKGGTDEQLKVIKEAYESLINPNHPSQIDQEAPKTREQRMALIEKSLFQANP